MFYKRMRNSTKSFLADAVHFLSPGEKDEWLRKLADNFHTLKNMRIE